MGLADGCGTSLSTDLTGRVLALWIASRISFMTSSTPSPEFIDETELRHGIFWETLSGVLAV